MTNALFLSFRYGGVFTIAEDLCRFLIPHTLGYWLHGSTWCSLLSETLAMDASCFHCARLLFTYIFLVSYIKRWKHFSLLKYQSFSSLHTHRGSKWNHYFFPSLCVRGLYYWLFTRCWFQMFVTYRKYKFKIVQLQYNIKIVLLQSCTHRLVFLPTKECVTVKLF